LVDLVAADRLSQRLGGALAAFGGSCMEVRVAGSTVYARQPDAALLPASNLKLLTALAALIRLGSGATLPTEVRVGRAPAGGVVDGPVWLVGGGDPLLITPGYRATQHEWTWTTEPGTRLDALADKIVAAGVRTITGGVLGDDSRYDSQRAVATWKPTYLSGGEIGAVGALVVDGGFASLTHHAPAAQPAVTAAQALTTLLRQRGVAVLGPPGRGTVPASATAVASMTSLPLRQLVGVMLRESDNLSAELLVKELGRRFGGAGSWAAGLRVVQQTLASTGLPMDGLVLTDGSGLDRGDRATCRLLVRAVDVTGPPSPAVTAIADVVDGLPVAARSGTLVRRMIGQAAAGRLRAKTGSLAGVAALTGQIAPAAGTGPPPDFALLANGALSDAAGRGLEDGLAAILATYPDAPAESGLVAPGT
jgi:D-alanyl-D-alanine carboxypeptidase/D-alanyl-D-alanine-endopeptidase (penicillin-binding protein 4)